MAINRRRDPRVEWREAMMPHLGAIIVLLTAVGYAVGYASLLLYALGLGVSPQDFGLTQADYLLLAGLWGLFFAVAALGSAMLVFFRTSLLGPLALMAVPLTLMFFPLPPAAGVIVLVGLLILVPLILVWTQSRFARTKTPYRPTVVIHLVILAGIICAAGWICWQWGRFVASDPDKAGLGGPIALYLVLPPTEGIATLPSGEERCLLRVSNSVFVTEDLVFVGSEPLTFRSTPCFP